MLEKAKEKLNTKLKTAMNWDEFMVHLNNRNAVLAPWCEENACEEVIKKKSGEDSKEMAENEEALTGAAKSLCIPMDQPELKPETVCFSCGK